MRLITPETVKSLRLTAQTMSETLLTIAETLKIDIKELLCSTQMCNQDDGIQI